MQKELFRLRVRGYVSEVFCGEIPVGCKQAFTRYLLGNRNAAEIPSWVIKRCPHYVSPEEIKRLWYEKNDVMKELFSEQGAHWENYRAINHLHHVRGFGSGKEGLGLFEIILEKSGQVVLEYVPFEPTLSSPYPLAMIDRLKQEWLEPPAAPSPHEGHVAVSSGSWAKGTMVFPLPPVGDFREEALDILVADLSTIGIGEDYFVVGFCYGGHELQGEIIRETDREMHQVVWYSPARKGWLDMYEMGEA